MRIAKKFCMNMSGNSLVLHVCEVIQVMVITKNAVQWHLDLIDEAF